MLITSKFREIRIFKINIFICTYSLNSIHLKYSQSVLINERNDKIMINTKCFKKKY